MKAFKRQGSIHKSRRIIKKSSQSPKKLALGINLEKTEEEVLELKSLAFRNINDPSDLKDLVNIETEIKEFSKKNVLSRQNVKKIFLNKECPDEEYNKEGNGILEPQKIQRHERKSRRLQPEIQRLINRRCPWKYR